MAIAELTVKRIATHVVESPARRNGTKPDAGTSFRQIFAPSQADFDQAGLTDDQLSDFVEAEVKAYRAERAERENQGK